MPPNWPKLEIPFSAGLFAGGDERAIPAPFLTKAKNAELTHGPTPDSVAIRKRKPYTDLGNDIAGGGNLIGIGRKLATYGDELLLFSNNHVYTYGAANDQWYERAEYLAPKITERPFFQSPLDQVTPDRAELDGVTAFCWAADGAVYFSAIDSETGAALLAPTLVNDDAERPRLVALADKFVLFYIHDTSQFTAVLIDPANIEDGSESSSLLDTAVGPEYDVAIDPSDPNRAVFVINETGSTSYTLGEIDEQLSLGTTSTKSRDSANCLSLAMSDDNLFVVRHDGSNIAVDILNPVTFADASVDNAVGSLTLTDPPHITCAVDDSGVSDELHVFWSTNEASGAQQWSTAHNTIDENANIDTAAVFITRAAPASRAFVYNRDVFLWLVFAGDSRSTGFDSTEGVRLQNTYFLYRGDGTLIAKAATNRAGGFVDDGHLPNVQSNAAGDVFTFAGTDRRIVPVGDDDGEEYSDRGVREIVVAFDDDAARRTVELGKTLYIAGGQVAQFDGLNLAELGFHIYPWSFVLTTDTGSIDAGAYTYKVTWRWDNAKGERERSTTATLAPVDPASDFEATLSIFPLYTTLKQGDIDDPIVEVWRTAISPTLTSPFYLTNSQDPADATNPNKYLVNDPTAFSVTYEDDLTDDELTDNEANPENGAVLENLAPPAASIIATMGERIFLAGIPGRPYTVAYSKLRGRDELAAFHDALVVDLPNDGGDITALGVISETLVVFKENAVYALPGQGFDNIGGGQNFGPARLIAGDVGAQSQEVIGNTPAGIVFHSDKGWYLLDRSFSVQYIGAAVEDFDSDAFTAVTVLEDKHQIRCLSTTRCLVYDYVIKQWAEWEISGLDAVIYDGKYTYLDANGVHQEATDYTGVDYSLDIETSWIKPFGPQGYGRVRTVMLLGEYRSAHDVRWRIGRDYDDTSYVDDVVWTATPTTVGGPLQAKHGLSFRKCEAISVRITDQTVDSATPATGESFRLTGIALRAEEIGGLKRLPAARRG